MTTPELFHVTSTITEFHGCKDVCMAWFNTADAWPDLPFAALIEGYDELAPDLRCYPEMYVAELFTAEQAVALVTYLDQHHGHESVQTTRRVKLPVPGNIMGYGAIPVGGLQDFHLLCKEKEWTLPFEVWGYYDLRQHEPVAGHEAARTQPLTTPRRASWDTNAANDNTLTDNIKPTKPVDHCMHVATLRWAQAAFYDGLDAEAERRGHVGMSIKFAESATELRIEARIAEADAWGMELEVDQDA
jgi:hypothetical protein